MKLKAHTNRTTPLYSASPARDRVTSCALRNAHRQLSFADQYWSWRKQFHVFIVVRREYRPTNSIVTRFRMARVISNTFGRLRCSCKFFERHGFPCRHLYTIMGQVNVTDFDVRWWRKYGRFYDEPGKDVLYLFLTIYNVAYCIQDTKPSQGLWTTYA